MDRLGSFSFIETADCPSQEGCDAGGTDLTVSDVGVILQESLTIPTSAFDSERQPAVTYEVDRLSNPVTSSLESVSAPLQQTAECKDTGSIELSVHDPNGEQYVLQADVIPSTSLTCHEVGYLTSGFMKTVTSLCIHIQSNLCRIRQYESRMRSIKVRRSDLKISISHKLDCSTLKLEVEMITLAPLLGCCRGHYKYRSPKSTIRTSLSCA